MKKIKIKEQKCIFCSSKFKDKQSLYDHIQNNHSASVPDNMSVSQYVFNLRYKKEFGSCVICKNKTKWNESTERYDRLCSQRCKEEYKKAFQKRMIDKHGKVYLTRDPEHQRKMLANRKISGKYKWSDGISEVGYTGSYELEFLKFLDIVMNFNANDVISPAPQNFFYKDNDGKERFYFPDFFIPSLNLIIEIKDGGDNPNKHHKIQEVDKKLEKIKDEIMRNQKQYNYVKVSNNNFSDFINYLIDLKQYEPETIKAPLVRINESFFKNMGERLAKNCEFKVSEQLLETNSDIMIKRILSKDLDKKLYIEPERNNKGNYIIQDLTRYGLKEEKMFPLNNANEFKNSLRSFNNCPPLKRKKLAESLLAYSKEFNHSIPSSSLIWNYLPKVLKEDNLHDNCHHGNDRYDVYNLKLDNIEIYPDINKILDEKGKHRIYMGSDWHLFQTKRKNIFTKHKVENINELLIDNQIRTVGDDDVFIFMGDLVNDEFIGKDELILKLSRLKGYKILVLGNNDVFPESFYYKCGFNKVVKGFKWNNFVFTHTPIKVDNEHINIHGHIHGSRSYMKMKSENHIDVYSDLYSYTPITLNHAIELYNKGFYLGQDFAPDYHFDRVFMKETLKENYSIGDSIRSAREKLSLDEKNKKSEVENSFALFRLMGHKIEVTITNVKGSSDNKHGYYAVNYGLCPISDSQEVPIYVLGLINPDIQEGSKFQVNIIGCVERSDGSEILIGKYVHNNRLYNPLQISTLIYPQERHHKHDLYLYDEKSKITQIVDIDNGYMDIDSEDFMQRLIESVSLDVEGNILLNTKHESDFMARYMMSHKLLKIYEKTKSYENIKAELCKLYYMLVLIETYYVKPNNTNPITSFLRSKNANQALKAKAFITNDFNKYLKLVLEQEPNFNFSNYFSKTEYYRDVIKITPDMIRGLKGILQSIVF